MIKGIFLDLDGTVYRGAEAVPGAADFLNRLADNGLAYLFVTNRANRSPEAVAEHLRSYDIPCLPEHVLTAAQATAQHLPPGLAYVIGEDGLISELRNAGFTLTDQNPDYVIVGFDRNITYDKLTRAARFVHAGVRFIATNPDNAINTEHGIAPANGAIVAAVAAASGKAPEIVGKPKRAIIDIALHRLGIAPEHALMVGDNLHTDIAAGHHAGVRTALILTGISTREEAGDASIKPTWVVESYAELDARIQEENRA